MLLRIRLLLAAACALLLSSCVDIEQDLWINADGSGRLNVDMAISKAMVELMKGLAGEAGDGAENPFNMEATKAKLEANPNVESVKIAQKAEGEFVHYLYQVKVRDVTKIDLVQEGVFEGGPGNEAPEGEFTIEKLASGNFRIAAELKGQKVTEEEKPDPQALALIKQMFGDSAFTFRVHGAAVEHNGTSIDGGTEWSLPLVDLAAGKSLSIEAEVKALGP